MVKQIFSKIIASFLLVVVLLCFSSSVFATFTSEYPTFSWDYVKAGSYGSEFYPWYALDPSKSLTGAINYQSWVAPGDYFTNQRFHIDLGSAKIIERIYYENGHYFGTFTNAGIKNFTFWGSNDPSSFSQYENYNTDTNWTQLTTDQSTLDEHVAVDQADPKYILVANSTAYRYYAFKFADNYGSSSWFWVRRIELQSQSGVTPTLTPTPSPTSTPVTTSTPTNTPIPTTTPTTATGGDGGGGTASAPTCNDQKPGSAPVLLSAVSTGANSITLTWAKANNPVSYYLVTFGTKPGEQLYGNPNVGGPDTTSYTVKGLSGGTKYYFEVRAGNGCMPGDYSNELSSGSTGGFIAGVPGGFSPDVLGASIGPNGQTSPRLPSAGYPPQLGFFQRLWGFVRGIFGR